MCAQWWGAREGAGCGSRGLWPPEDHPGQGGNPARRGIWVWRGVLCWGCAWECPWIPGLCPASRTCPGTRVTLGAEELWGLVALGHLVGAGVGSGWGSEGQGVPRQEAIRCWVSDVPGRCVPITTPVWRGWGEFWDKCVLERGCGAPGGWQSLRSYVRLCDGGYVVGGSDIPGHWGICQRVLWGTVNIWGGVRVPKGCQSTGGAKAEGQQVGDKGLERSLGETCQSMSPP